MNPYEILNIPKNANNTEIKKAYHKLAVKHHPDKGGDPEDFKRISEAYEILSNPSKRRNYDNMGVFDMNDTFDPMNLFREFMSSSFMDPHNITTHPFSGFQEGAFNQGDLFNGLFTNMDNLNHSFSQTTVIHNNHKVTTTTENGITTVIEECLGDPFTTRYLSGK